MFIGERLSNVNTSFRHLDQLKVVARMPDNAFKDRHNLVYVTLNKEAKAITATITVAGVYKTTSH
jgi:hypothetical protein